MTAASRAASLRRAEIISSSRSWSLRWSSTRDIPITSTDARTACRVSDSGGKRELHRQQAW